MSLKTALRQHFENGIKKDHRDEIGVEIEHFVVEKASLTAVPFAGKNGVREILKRLSKNLPKESLYLEEDLLGFMTPEYRITLEPAAQLEISIEKSASVKELERIYDSFRLDLDKALEPFGYTALTVGCQPVSRVNDLNLIPKERYRLMDRHFQKTGTGGRKMMRGTASVQVSVDYYSEKDFQRKIQAAYFFMPVLKLLTDHSDFFEGKKLKHPLKRTDIWETTDAARCGILPMIFDPDYGFDHYSAFLERMPLIFTEGASSYLATGFQTTGELFSSHDPDEAELNHILSMAFPDVRLKNYLEIRFADSMPKDYMLGYAALIKGLLYQEEALDYARDRIRDEHLTERDVEDAERELMKKGWDAAVYGEPVRNAARSLLHLAANYLSPEEREYLAVFRPVIDAGGISRLEALKEKKLLSPALLREEYHALIEKDPEKNRLGALALKDNMERSPLYFRDRFTSKTLQIPRLYTKKDIARFQRIVSTTYGIFEKVILEYLHHPDYRALFPFSKELEELILLPNGYDSLLPIARFDIFYHEDTGEFYFCEINTDGTSGMNEDRLQDEFNLDNPAHQAMRRRYRFQTFELFSSWVKTFLSLYDTWEKKTGKPSIAIVDFLDTGTLREFQEFARHFQKAGADCEVVDIRELTYKNGHLYSPSGNLINAIYRRAVTTDIMEHLDEVSAFLSAVRENTCFVAGSFATQIIHHKWLFHVLHLPRTKEILTPAEWAFVEKHVPKTLPFREGVIPMENVLSEKDRYILKPDDSYASNGVYAGVEFHKEEWEEKVRSAYQQGYICQEYCPQFSTENIDFAWGDGTWKSYLSMAGLYVYNGRFAGVFSRAAEGSGIIASHRNERTQTTYVVSRLPESK